MLCYLPGNKHRSEFKFLVDQVNKRWKKTGDRKAEKAQNEEEVAVKELPAATGQWHLVLSTLGVRFPNKWSFICCCSSRIF